MAFWLLAVPALAAAPATLTCVDNGTFDLRADPPGAPAWRDGEEPPGTSIVHVDPASGEWYLQVVGSRALTNGGGTFEVRRESAFERYWEEWVGIDQDTMLRIRGGGTQPLRFLFVSHRQGHFAGLCTEPHETFIFLGEPTP